MNLGSSEVLVCSMVPGDPYLVLGRPWTLLGPNKPPVSLSKPHS